MGFGNYNASSEVGEQTNEQELKIIEEYMERFKEYMMVNDLHDELSNDTF